MNEKRNSKTKRIKEVRIQEENRYSKKLSGWRDRRIYSFSKESAFLNVLSPEEKKEQ